MLNLTKDQIISALSAKSYKIFDNYIPNIVGIRSATRSAGTFDDSLYTWWKDGDNEVLHNYTITTDPGLTYLRQPIAGSKGTAILVPGQYFECYRLGSHRGKQEALIQTGGMIKVYRDNNKDGILNMDPSTIQEGYFGINLHHGAINDGEVINGWSAGCQVWRYHTPHELLIKDFKALSTKYKFEKFTYTLLQEEDFK